MDYFSRENNARPKRITQAALEALQRYRWKGNIRELRNTVERLIIMTAGDVDRRGRSAERRAVAVGGGDRRPGVGAAARPTPRRPARCASSRTTPSAPTWSASCARTAGTSRRPPRSSTRRAATSTRSSSSIRSRRKPTGRQQALQWPAHRALAMRRSLSQTVAVVAVSLRRLPRRAPKARGERKVRTPQGSAPGNARSGQPEGKWHRKYTALALRSAAARAARVPRAKAGKGEKVR